jgi:hypothetical protein
MFERVPGAQGVVGCHWTKYTYESFFKLPTHPRALRTSLIRGDIRAEIAKQDDAASGGGRFLRAVLG